MGNKPRPAGVLDCHRSLKAPAYSSLLLTPFVSGHSAVPLQQECQSEISGNFTGMLPSPLLRLSLVAPLFSMFTSMYIVISWVWAHCALTHPWGMARNGVLASGKRCTREIVTRPQRQTAAPRCDHLLPGQSYPVKVNLLCFLEAENIGWGMRCLSLRMKGKLRHLRCFPGLKEKGLQYY
jgi:hypothetical protein